MSLEHVSLYSLHADEASATDVVLGSPEAADRVFKPSADELGLLSEHEPGIKFRPVADATVTGGISVGRQSRVTVLEYDHEERTYRVVWKRMGAGKGLDLDEARQLRERLNPYRSSLEDSGWHVPKLLYSKVEKLGNEFQIFSYEEFIPGGDAEHMIADREEPNFRKWYVVEKVLRALYSYPIVELKVQTILGQQVTMLPHGLDLKLANLVLNSGTSQLFFVDLFGPKELYQDGQWVTYTDKLDSLPPDQLKVVTATREGLILRFWRLARRTWEPEKERRRLLQDDFIEILAGLCSDEREFRFIRGELDSDFQWLNDIYREHRV
jgi:hypothetical protein